MFVVARSVVSNIAVLFAFRDVSGIERDLAPVRAAQSVPTRIRRFSGDSVTAAVFLAVPFFAFVDAFLQQRGMETGMQRGTGSSGLREAKRRKTP